MQSSETAASAGKGHRTRPEVVVITGGSAGVGRATVRRFAREGARVVLLARGSVGLEAARREVEELGGEGLAIVTDVALPEAVEAAAQAAEQHFGPIDVWINDAMATVFSRFQDVSPEEFKRVTEVTYLGQVYGTMAALKRMLRRDRGVIVNVGSALAYRSIPLQSAYCGAKHAIVGFTDSLRCELEHDQRHVRLTVVHLPGMNTPQFTWGRNKMGRMPQPVPPIFEPEVAADAIYWAAHHDRREVFVGGSTFVAIQGQKIAPGIGDRYLARTGFDSQMHDGIPALDKPDNLFEPVAGDFGARGPFAGRACDQSYYTWTTLHRSLVSLGAGMLALAGLCLWIRRRHDS
ncbi:MAG: SDR family oxidoreductase [Cyanobacteria bacterium REEB65]|nr:SDR family oxidoreductase [Cyanobacteria bacterium REEB65]